MVRALQDTVLLGVTTNVPYLLDILQTPAFQEGRTTTKFLEEQLPKWQPTGEVDETTWLALAAFEMLQGGAGGKRLAGTGEDATVQPDPWAKATGWRNV
jgi:geranyl-CoA carboxylase alpha subunit